MGFVWFVETGFKPVLEAIKYLNIRLDWRLISIVILGFLVYSNIFSNQLVWDDAYFLGHPQYQNLNLQNWINFFKGELPVNQGDLYRPIRSITYNIIIQLFKANPYPYHYISILVHLLNTSLIYLLGKKIFKNTNIGWMAGLLFALHPLHVEATTWITALFDTLGSTWYLLTWWLIINRRENKNFRNTWLIGLTSLLAFLTYELTYPLFITLALYLKLTYGWNWKQVGLKIKPILYSISISLILRFINISSTANTPRVYNSWWQQILLIITLIKRYVEMLILPFRLSINHKVNDQLSAFYYLDNIKFEPNSIRPGIGEILIVFILISLFVWMWQHQSKAKVQLWLILSILVSFLPVIQIVPQKMLLAEKYTYLASIFYCWLVGWFFYFIRKHFNHTKLWLSIFFLGYIGFLGTQTYQRNQIWKNSLTLWESQQEDRKSPYVQKNLAASYAIYQMQDESEAAFLKAIELNQSDFLIKQNLGYLYYQQNKYEQAIYWFQEAIKIEPKAFLSYNLLSKSYQAVGNTTASQEIYQKGIEEYNQNPREKIQLKY